MSPPLIREADLRDQRLQRWGGQMVGGALGLLGIAGLIAWAFLAEDMLPLVALAPPTALLVAGAALVAWSRGIDAIPDPDLPTFDELPPTDPRRVEPRAVRRARWIWCGTLWAAGMCLSATAAWLSKDLLPGWIRLVGFLAVTLGPTLLAARWMEATNGESGWPAR
ncbi:MAG: hypothetical protein CL927_08950 [Deltaproteobacteria bacterium]|nr:hypothetical protein [Deltaproteobacteria bacterium]HCH64396.1 hypothetical protein [Deltaproteobacteria bacterium]